MDANLNDANEREGSRFVGWQLYRIAATESLRGRQAAPLPSAGRSHTFFIRVYSRAFAVGFESGARPYRSFFETSVGVFR